MKTKFDIITTCPICGEAVSWLNGSTNNGLIYIKTKRKSVLVIHEKCVDKERRLQNEHIDSKKEH